MHGRRLSAVFAAASVVVAMLFGGYRAAEAAPSPVNLSAPTEQTLPEIRLTLPEPATLPGETVPYETQPEAHRQETLACAAAAAEMTAKHIFVYDCREARMIYCNTGELDVLYPASITKLYTAYLALMYLDPETVVTAGEELSLVRPGSSTAYIGRGHKLTVEMLVEAMLLPSGNDAAYVLAAAAGREIGADPELGGKEAVEIFVEEMNRQAASLGLQNSCFVNPDGYHQERHVSCPLDLALAGSLALENPVITKYAGLYADAVTFQSGQKITWYNTNRLVNPESSSFSPLALGGKTGYTKEAGYCLLTVFANEERRILVGIFGSEDKLSRYAEALKLVDALALQ